jgi:hypothetical protein
MRRFLVAKRVTVVLVDRIHAGPWPGVLASLRLVPQQTGGVLLYRLDPAWARRSP